MVDPVTSGDPFVQNGATSSDSATDRKGKGKERDNEPSSLFPLSFSSATTSIETREPVISSLDELGDVERTCDQSAPLSTTTYRTSLSRRHSLSHTITRRPSSLTRLKAKFSSPRTYRKVLFKKKLPTPPAQIAIPQLTPTVDVHTHSPAPLSLEVKLPLGEIALETVMPVHTLFRTKGRSNSSPLPVSALDYIPVHSEDLFAPIPIPSSRNLFDEVLPKELKLHILMSLVALHESDQVKLISQADWSITRAISSKNRWLGRDRAVREMVKLSRVSKTWRNLIYDGQLWSTLEFRAFPTMSKVLLSNIAKSGGRFINSIDLSGHVHVSPTTLIDIADNMCFSPPFAFTQLTSLNLRGCTALSTRSLHYLLVRSPALKQVCLKGLHAVTNKTWDIIAMYCPRITELDLNRCPNMDAAGLKSLALTYKARGELLQWTELRVSGLKNINDSVMELLGQVAPFLEVLDLSYARQLHNSALDAFVALQDSALATESVLLTSREAGRDPSDYNRYRRRVTRLRHLSLSSCNLLTDIACSHLAHTVPRLEFLELGGIGDELGDEGLIRLLNTTPMIRRLDLEDAVEISDALLSAITPGPPAAKNGATDLQPGHALEHLVISYATEITDNALLALIRGCTRLKVLEVDNTHIGPSVLRKFCELRRTGSKIVAVDCRSIPEGVVKDLAPLIRPRRGWRGWDARKLRFLDGRDFGVSQSNSGERDKEKEAIMKVALGQDELDEARVVVKTFYSWQLVDAVWSARDKRRKAISRRKANESSGSTETDPEELNGVDRTRWWSPGGRSSRSASGSNSPLALPDANGGDTCVIM
ncbi:hypothetical protein BDP27DRAFT_1213285 [Rhodocollybia butyracea]|uniref:RNI-like protein n=1 Tax=Rhodocollybia butyracea TaxID=206335 RepID=A0A9P5UDB4_9AGAR|nr:hypothetical protein BDP27DRAFT_1213285 [Rhodocollybia butyracea]